MTRQSLPTLPEISRPDGDVPVDAECIEVTPTIPAPARCYHPCACTEPCSHGPRCANPPLPGGLCAEHGCVRCGQVILADYEDERLCGDCGVPEYSWPTDLPPLSLRLLREVAECLRARPVSGEGEGLTWSLNGCADGREFFRMGP